MPKRVVVVWRATKGNACAVAALSRLSSEAPQILCEDEVAEFPWSNEHEVIFPELIIAYLNRSPITPLIDLAKKISARGARVLGHNASYSPKPAFARLIAAACVDTERSVQGYRAAVCSCVNPDSVDEDSLALLRMADSLDFEQSVAAEESLERQVTLCFSEVPDEYRAFVGALV